MENKPKVLIVAFAQSSHTHAWVNLIDRQKFDVRLFGLQNSTAGQNVPFYSYHYDQNYPFTQVVQPGLWVNKYNAILRQLNRHEDHVRLERDWLKRIIASWRPDIIHTLGLDPAATFFLDSQNSFSTKAYRWVATIRGGSDLELERFNPDKQKTFQAIFHQCDWAIADNRITYSYAFELGLAKQKRAFDFLPGTGGIDIEAITKLRKRKTSQSRIILWPKAYNCPYSKSLPVLEALKLAWAKIQPCQIIMTALDEETRKWWGILPAKIKKNTVVFDRVERKKLLHFLAQARVVLIPSLIDGVPNTLYEAMATKTLPIVSPLKTIKTVIGAKNALFARNLYPREIARSLQIAMRDDKLVDKISENNLRLVKKIADRHLIGRQVNEFYQRILS